MKTIIAGAVTAALFSVFSAFSVPAHAQSTETEREPSGQALMCHQTEDCRTRGACSEVEGVCAVARDQDCWRSEFCAYGKCHAVGGRCVALSGDDCVASPACQQAGWCEFDAGTCRAPAHLVPMWKSRAEVASGGRAYDGGTDGSTNPSGGGAFLGIGISLTAVGGIALLTGAVVGIECVGGAAEGGLNACDKGPLAAGLLLGGLGGLGAGIPLTVVGARRLRGNKRREPELYVGAGSVSLVTHF
jgi:hypothetical protein